MKRFIINTCIYIFAIFLVVVPPEIYKIATSADLGDVPGGEARITGDLGVVALQQPEQGGDPI